MELKQSILSKLANIIVALGVSMFIIILISFIFKVVFPDYLFPEFSKTIPPIQHLLHSCVFAPIFEEFVWRFIPIEMLKKTKFFEDSKYYIIGLIAVMFGMAHGSFINVLVQGVAGFFFGWVYIKNNMSYTSSAITHSFYNLTVLVLIPSII